MSNAALGRLIADDIGDAVVDGLQGTPVAIGDRKPRSADMPVPASQPPCACNF